jgi:hypothetical protein
VRSVVIKVNLSGNQQVQTDGTILNNKPDIIIRDKDKGTRILIYAAITGKRNVTENAAENILKYKYLKTEIQHM